MGIPLLPHASTTSRRFLRSTFPCSFTATSAGANGSPWNSNGDHDDRDARSLRYYSVLSPVETLAAKQIRRPCRAFFGHNNRQQSLYRNYIGSATIKTAAKMDQLPFLKNPSKLPPSSSSILKQEDHELSTAEVQLKKSLQEYMHRTEEDRTDTEKCDDEGDYLLENLQRAYTDLEYWEEVLQIEVYKCRMYLSEGTDEYADSIHAQGKYYLRQEDFPNSKQLYKEALEYFERTENLVQQGHVLISLAGWYFFRNQLDDALESLQRSETMLDSNPALLYKCLDNQGLIHRLRGEFHVALDKYQQALQVVVAEDTETQLALKMHIADMYLALEAPNDALQVYQDLLMELPSTLSTSTAANSEQQNHQLGMRGVLLHNIATIHVDQGEHELALDLFGEALKAKKSAGGEHNSEVAKTLNSLGALHAGSFGEKEVALEYFHETLLIARIHANDGENPRDDPDVMNALQNISVMEQDLAADR
jgi:tetratricopeptide (TPR) repeat protein